MIERQEEKESFLEVEARKGKVCKIQIVLPASIH